MIQKLFDHVSLPKLFVGMCVTGFCALGIHTVMLETLKVPYPGTAIHAPLAQFISRGFLNILALIVLYSLAKSKLARRGFVFRWAVLFLLSTALTEALFRLPFMNGYCTDSVFPFLTNLPNLSMLLVSAAMIVASANHVARWWQKTMAAVAIAAINLYLLTPLFDALFGGMLTSLQYLAHPNWCELPYGWKVALPADISFIEPVLAAFAAVALVWDRLSVTPVIRVLQFTLLVMLIRRQVLAAFIYMATSGERPLVGLASMGQFSLEALLLGLLTALTWQWARRPAIG